MNFIQSRSGRLLKSHEPKTELFGIWGLGKSEFRSKNLEWRIVDGFVGFLAFFVENGEILVIFKRFLLIFQEIKEKINISYTKNA